MERRVFPQGDKLFKAPKIGLKGPEGQHLVQPKPKDQIPPELLKGPKAPLAHLNLEIPPLRNFGIKGLGDVGHNPGLKKAPKDLEVQKPKALKEHAPKGPGGDPPPGHIYKSSYVLDEAAFNELRLLGQGVVLNIERGVFSPTHTLMKDGVLQYPISWATDVSGIRTQGMMFEDVAASMLPPALRLRAGFKVFDFYDRSRGLAISLKTLNTNAATYTKSPSQVYSKLKEYVDKTLSFTQDKHLGADIFAEQISIRRIELGIPENISEAQWRHIERAMDYARSKGIEFNVIKIKVT